VSGDLILRKDFTPEICVCEDSGTAEAWSPEVNQSRRFSEDTWRQIVNFRDFPLRRIRVVVVRNFPKCRSLKLLWVVDLKGEACTVD
jgi:hypothetical protein